LCSFPFSTSSSSFISPSFLSFLTWQAGLWVQSLKGAISVSLLHLLLNIFFGPIFSMAAASVTLMRHIQHSGQVQGLSRTSCTDGREN
jgi:hypothetical protein